MMERLKNKYGAFIKYIDSSAGMKPCFNFETNMYFSKTAIPLKLLQYLFNGHEER